MAGELSGFVGRFGSGKTLLMTYKAWKQHGAWDEVWTNYGLNADRFPRTKLCRFRSGKEFFDVLAEALVNVDGRPGAPKRLFLIDEIHSLFDARGWGQLPLEALTPLSQLRKAGVSIWYTSQHESQVEKRIRNYTNSLWLCRSWGRSFNMFRDAPLVFWAKEYDAFEFRKIGAENIGFYLARLTKCRGDLYDTFEVVDRMSLDGVGETKVSPELAMSR